MLSMPTFRRRLPSMIFADEPSDTESMIVTVPFETTMSLSPQINHFETPHAYVYKAELPGFTKNDVDVEIQQGNVLCVKGEKKATREERTERGYRVQSSSGKYMRRFRLPENSKADSVDAVWEHGLLTVTVPKKHVSHETYNDDTHVKAIQV